ncbi:ATP-dependent DNA helicase RecG (modular protein) [Candidatus Methylacidiphilum fumarolicum]|uniref:ATP-dependent DNA helicase RecG (Modular protein) n=1 Tax=Candidatus Methylacidiphilum fumarolicum TaxID=591154 RepID=A0ABN8XII4_9BACT|nr:DEAD/DEAH box helicase [Candidatus Methylacidiphilum fumarolicum]CAI9085934.1 ATP-dependent DNA helicase RecG (modular protein) [Candidatus Methylacidiphilum fumarolicum]
MNELVKEAHIGIKRARLLEKLGIVSKKTLLLYLPFRYENRSEQKSLFEVAENETLLFKGTITVVQKGQLKARATVKINLLSFSNQREQLVCIWFWKTLPHYLSVGQKLAVYGTVRLYKGKWTMWQPEVEPFEEEKELSSSLNLFRIVPIYSTTSGLSQKVFRQIMHAQLQKINLESTDPYPLPENLKLPTLAFAIKKVHFPDFFSQIQQCRDRIAYHEFFVEQLRMAYRKLTRSKIKIQRPTKRLSLCSTFFASLPFVPTSAQKKAIAEIDHDLEASTPMNRLLMGDVGSGKTLVAVYAAIKTVERGQDVLFMSPTSTLASQHYLTLKNWLTSLHIPIFYVGKESKQNGELASTNQSPYPLFKGESSSTALPGKVFVGTHALLFRSFDPQSLGLIIIDEQHKFGVAQRSSLAKKGVYPDILTMTATPIPRTLALSLYGDLDFSILDALPSNRGKIVTKTRSSDALPKIWEFIKDQLRQRRLGNQNKECTTNQSTHPWPLRPQCAYLQ